MMSSFQDHSIANGVVGVMVQSAMAELVANVSSYLQVLTSEVVQQARATHFKSQICLQAQFLELQQLRLQLTDALKMVSSLTSDNSLLQNMCTERDCAIAKLSDELVAANTEPTDVVSVAEHEMLKKDLIESDEKYKRNCLEVNHLQERLAEMEEHVSERLDPPAVQQASVFADSLQSAISAETPSLCVSSSDIA